MSHGKKRKKKNCPTQSCYEGEIIHRGQNCSVYLAVEYFLTWESVGIDCLLNQPHRGTAVFDTHFSALEDSF